VPANASPTLRRTKTLNTDLFFRMFMVRFVLARPRELYCHPARWLEWGWDNISGSKFKVPVG
jgi:hypothetical protein